MQHTDFTNLSVELKTGLRQVGEKLFHEVEYYMENLKSALMKFDRLTRIDADLKGTTGNGKAALAAEQKKLLEQYHILLNMAKAALEILEEEKREVIFSLHPELFKARKLLSEILATEKDLRSFHSNAAVPGNQLPPIQKNVSKFEIATQDVIKDVLKFLNLSELTQMRLVSKKHKAIVDDLLTQPANVITAIDNLSFINAMEFIDFYMQSQRYMDLRRKFDEKGKLSSFEIICIALTTPNIYELRADDLDRAIDALAKILSVELAENLYIMSDLIRIKEAKNPDERDELLLQNQFDSRQLGKVKKYMNIQGADIPQGFQKLADCNFKNAKFPGQMDYKFKLSKLGAVYLVSLDAFKSPNMMIRQLNQLEKMLSNTTPKQKHNLRNWIVEECWSTISCIFNYYKLEQNNNVTATKKRLEQLIKIIDVIQKTHPLTRKQFSETEFGRDVNLFFGTRELFAFNIHSTLTSLKEKIEAFVKEVPKDKPSRSLK